jgi:hypothetical protein
MEPEVVRLEVGDKGLEGVIIALRHTGMIRSHGAQAKGAACHKPSGGH